MTYNPWQDAAQRYPWVQIEWRPIAPMRGLWAPSEDVILIDSSISKVQRRCALAHEIAHMDVGDRAVDSCWFSTRQETLADRVAARRLIEFPALAAAARWCQDPREVAEHLDVTLDVLVLRCSMLHPAERGHLDRVLQLRDLVA